MKPDLACTLVPHQKIELHWAKPSKVLCAVHSTAKLISSHTVTVSVSRLVEDGKLNCDVTRKGHLRFHSWKPRHQQLGGVLCYHEGGQISGSPSSPIWFTEAAVYLGQCKRDY